MVQLQDIIGIVREASALMVRGGFDVHDNGSRENIVTYWYWPSRFAAPPRRSRPIRLPCGKE